MNINLNLIFNSMSLSREKEYLISELIRNGYLKTPKVVKAFKIVPREKFVPEKYKKFAYSDQPLPIGYGQTISAPHMVAIMTELLEPKKTDKVLEIGSGSGYQAAILSRLVKFVYTVEFEKGLCEFAEKNLKNAGYRNIKIIRGDGSKGYQKESPYDKIIVTCASEKIFPEWIEQLKTNGIIVAPIGSHWSQILTVGIKTKTGLQTKEYFNCVFVPLRKNYSDAESIS